MSLNRQKRAHAKALRRKSLLAERGKRAGASGDGRWAAVVRRAVAAPIHSCVVQAALFERGNGVVALTRRTSGHRMAMAWFLVDVFCLGVKDVMFEEAHEDDVEVILSTVAMTDPLEAVDPAYARKLLHEAVAYARSLGLEPPADFAKAERLFGDVAAEACDVQFEFGHAGRPCYIPGPGESLTQIRRRREQLRRVLGEDGFDFMDPMEMDEALLGDEDGYDPDVPPDPAAWLDLDEDERAAAVQDYHRRAGIELPNEDLHARGHVIIETQIAIGDELAARRTLERLMHEGLDRHDALHALCAVLFEEIRKLHQDEERSNVQDLFEAALETLTAEKWRRWMDEVDEDD
jgi:hypothetical protein